MPISFRIFQFIVVHTVKGFGIVNKAEMDVFLELSCFFDDPVDDGNLISGSSAFSKPSLSTWKFTVHVLLNVTIYSAHIYDQFRSQAETRRVRAVFRGFLAQRSVLCSISCVEEPAAGSDLPWRVS